MHGRERLIFANSRHHLPQRGCTWLAQLTNLAFMGRGRKEVLAGSRVGGEGTQFK